jgi:hypothetical protein
MSVAVHLLGESAHDDLLGFRSRSAGDMGYSARISMLRLMSDASVKARAHNWAAVVSRLGDAVGGWAAVLRVVQGNRPPSTTGVDA